MKSNAFYQKTDRIFLVALCVIFMLQLYRTRIGIGSADEQFYITLGWRLEQGDALFYDDWHIAQMIGFFIYPLVKLYRLIAGGNEGIVLGFRYFYILFNTLIGTAFYIRFRKYEIKAVFGALVLLLFSPFNFQALSYNSMAPSFLLLSILIYPFESNCFIRTIFSGFFYACAVLNTPYLLLLFLYATVITVFKKKWISHKKWLGLFIGASICMILFLILVLSRASITEILGSLSHLIDPSHSDNIFQLILKNGGRFLKAFHVFTVGFVCELWLALYAKKVESLRDKVLFINFIITLLAIIDICFVFPYQYDLGGYMLCLIPITIFGLTLLLIFDAELPLKTIFIVSLIHAGLISISSNVGPRTFSIALISACAVTMIFSFEHCKKKEAIFFESVVLGIFFFFKLTFNYLGDGDYTSMVEKGPLKGLKESPEIVEHIHKELEDIETINRMGSLKYAMLITNSPWEYLALEKRISTDSTYNYLWTRTEYISVQKAYEQIHNNKFPSYVYIEDDNMYEIQPMDIWIHDFKRLAVLNCGVVYIFGK